MKALKFIYTLFMMAVAMPKKRNETIAKSLTKEQKSDLSNPENEFYWETWGAVLDNVTIIIENKNYSLYQDDDLWAIPIEG